MFQPTQLQMEALAAVIRSTAAYQDNMWVSMGAIREMVRLNRAECDSLIKAAAHAGLITLIPEENQKKITPTMRYNAVYVGGEEKHYAMAD